MKTQNGMKKFSNHFGRWTAEDALLLYRASEALYHVAKCLSAVPCSHISTPLSVGLTNVCHICHGPPVTCTAMEYWLCHKDQYPSFKLASSGTQPGLGSCISHVH